MPQKLKRTFRQLREDNDALCWKIADKIAEVFTWTRAKGVNIQCTIMDVCVAVSLELDADYSAFRLYDFYLVCEKLPKQSHRVKVAPLPFSHLLWARQHSGDPEHRITFMEIVNRDLVLMDNHYGDPVSKNDLIEDITGHRPLKPDTGEGAMQGQSVGYSPTVNLDSDDTSPVEVIRAMYEAARFIEQGMSKLSKSATTAAQAVTIARVVEKFSSGATMARMLLDELISSVMV